MLQSHDFKSGRDWLVAGPSTPKILTMAALPTLYSSVMVGVI